MPTPAARPPGEIHLRLIPPERAKKTDTGEKCRGKQLRLLNRGYVVKIKTLPPNQQVRIGLNQTPRAIRENPGGVSIGTRKIKAARLAKTVTRGGNFYGKSIRRRSMGNHF